MQQQQKQQVENVGDATNRVSPRTMMSQMGLFRFIEAVDFHEEEENDKDDENNENKGEIELTRSDIESKNATMVTSKKTHTMVALALSIIVMVIAIIFEASSATPTTTTILTPENTKNLPTKLYRDAAIPLSESVIREIEASILPGCECATAVAAAKEKEAKDFWALRWLSRLTYSTPIIRGCEDYHADELPDPGVCASLSKLRMGGTVVVVSADTD